MLFVQDSALVEEERDTIPRSPGPPQTHETFTLETQDSNASGGRGNPSSTEGRSAEEIDPSQNEVGDSMKNDCADNQHCLSKLPFPCFVRESLCSCISTSRVKISQLVNKICSHCLFPVVDKSGTSCYHLVTRLMRPTESQQVVPTSLISSARNKLMTTSS